MFWPSLRKSARFLAYDIGTSRNFAGGGVGLYKKLVLVVEDDAHMRGLMINLLEEFFEVIAVPVADGKKALKLLSCFKPALVLLDLMLPDMEGLAIAQLVRRNAATRDVPIIAVSGVSGARDAAIAAGCFACLAKPFDLDQFLSAVERYLVRPAAVALR